MTPPVIPGLVPGIHLPACSDVSRWLDPGDKRRDDNVEFNLSVEIPPPAKDTKARLLPWRQNTAKLVSDVPRRAKKVRSTRGSWMRGFISSLMLVCVSAWRRLPRTLLAALLLVLTLTQSIPAQTQGSALEISTDEVVDDTWNNRVVARGNVEIRFFGEILTADEVIYDRQARKLTARGNITLQEADGKVTRADAMNLHDELRDAFVAYARRQKVRIDR